MKYRTLLLALALALLGTTAVVAQEKGVDSQSQRIRDTGSNRGAANNGTKTDVGTNGSGINFGKDKTKAAVMRFLHIHFASSRDYAGRCPVQEEV